MDRAFDSGTNSEHDEEYDEETEEVDAEEVDTDTDSDEDEDELPRLDEEMWLNIKRNDPNVTQVRASFEEGEIASAVDWEADGKWIASNTSVEEIVISDFFCEDVVPEDVEAYMRNFEAFLKGVGQNKSLKSICLDTCDHPNMLSNITPLLLLNSNLRTVKVWESKMEEADIRAFAYASISTRKQTREIESSLERFLFEANNIKDSSSAILIEALQGHEKLSRIGLSRNQIGFKGCTALGSLLQDFVPKLKSLDLCKNCIDDKAIAILANALSTNNTALKRLYLRRNKYVSDHGWEAFFGCFPNSNSTLEKLDIDGNKMGDKGVTALSSALGNNRTMKRLSMSSNKAIQSNGWEHLFTQLQHPRSSIHFLSIVNNNIDGRGAISLANALRNNTSLRELYIGGNSSILAQDWTEFFSVLQNHYLETLYIGGNKIHDECIPALSSSLFERGTLRVLALGSDGIGNEGCASMANSLMNCNTLRKLDLSYNSVTSVGLVALSRILQSHTLPLEELRLDGYAISDETFTSFATRLAHNNHLKELDFGYNGGLGVALPDGLLALATSLCNVSSINATYHSNHTLQSVKIHHSHTLPSNLLEMNQNMDKSQVARQKILMSHFSPDDLDENRSISDITQFDLEKLPHIISWSGRDEMGHSLLYVLLKCIPALFE